MGTKATERGTVVVPPFMQIASAVPPLKVAPLMRRILCQALRKEFAAAMQRELPQFSFTRQPVLPGGWFAYAREGEHDFMSYVVVAVHKVDSFDVELAWSPRGVFPTGAPLSMPRSMPDPDSPADDLRNVDYRFRLCHLWSPRDESWELIPRPTFGQLLRRQGDPEPLSEPELIEQGLKRLAPHVTEAVERVIAFGLPYIERMTGQPQRLPRD